MSDYKSVIPLTPYEERIVDQLKSERKAIERRLEAWKAHIGTNSEYSEAAPKIVAKLEAELALRSQSNQTAPDNGEGEK